MAAIIKDMEIPKACNSCVASGKGICCEWMNLSSIDRSSKRSKTCPVKSIDGLIKQIEETSFIDVTDPTQIIVDIIKEYCGIKE